MSVKVSIVFASVENVSDEKLVSFVDWLNSQLLATPYHDWNIMIANAKVYKSKKSKGKQDED